MINKQEFMKRKTAKPVSNPLNSVLWFAPTDKNRPQQIPERPRRNEWILTDHEPQVRLLTEIRDLLQKLVNK